MAQKGDWLSAIRRYLGVTLAAHVVWEALQVPLYGIWEDGSANAIAFAVVHCTGGDLLIAVASLVAALMLAGSPGWPAKRFHAVAALTIALGVLYTVYSEWLNVSVRGSWSYAARMPTLPPLGTGLSPLLQWIVVPGLALAAARPPGGGRSSASEPCVPADSGCNASVSARGRPQQPAAEDGPRGAEGLERDSGQEQQHEHRGRQQRSNRPAAPASEPE